MPVVCLLFGVLSKRKILNKLLKESYIYLSLDRDL